MNQEIKKKCVFCDIGNMEDHEDVYICNHCDYVEEKKWTKKLKKH